MEINRTQSEGFALLMTLIVVSVVLSIGLSILDLSIKQISLSTNARESETAFHAANAGMECARYWRRTESATMETMGQIDFDCFGVSDNNVSWTNVTTGVSGVGDVGRYDYEFTWGTAPDERCTRVTTFLMYASLPPDPGITVTNAGMKNVIPGYPTGPDTVCEAGAQCSVITVRGYNKACNNINTFGVTEREVLLEF